MKKLLFIFLLLPASVAKGIEPWMEYILRMQTQGLENAAAQLGHEIGGGMAPDCTARFVPGGTHVVNWTSALDDGIDPWGHVHPFDPKKPIIPWETSFGGAGPNVIQPSPADIRFTINNGGSHIVHTSYQWDPIGKRVVPLTPGGKQFSVAIEVPNPANPTKIFFQPLDGLNPIKGLGEVLDLEYVPYLDLGHQPKGPATRVIPNVPNVPSVEAPKPAKQLGCGCPDGAGIMAGMLINYAAGRADEALFKHPWEDQRDNPYRDPFMSTFGPTTPWAMKRIYESLTPNDYGRIMSDMARRRAYQRANDPPPTIYIREVDQNDPIFNKQFVPDPDPTGSMRGPKDGDEITPIEGDWAAGFFAF